MVSKNNKIDMLFGGIFLLSGVLSVLGIGFVEPVFLVLSRVWIIINIIYLLLMIAMPLMIEFSFHSGIYKNVSKSIEEISKQLIKKKSKILPGLLAVVFIYNRQYEYAGVTVLSLSANVLMISLYGKRLAELLELNKN